MIKTLATIFFPRLERQYSAQLPDTATQCDSSFQSALEIYAGVLNMAIIERSNEAAKNLSPFDELLLYKANRLNPLTYQEAITLQQVLDTIDTVGSIIQDSNCRAIIIDAFKKQIRPNALYNDSLTNKLLMAAMDEVVSIEGKIDKGTTIIDRGDVVNEYRYKVARKPKVGIR